ncbi:protein crumbs 2-like [Scleropages formosus]|uniref:Protein crumbs 2-like n=1 Tax=Scleropages formosus TaxID=113540 RepID=A0A0P7V816_SCLFO|nr:protein crumbs 2-like [Scleropages formosus]
MLEPGASECSSVSSDTQGIFCSESSDKCLSSPCQNGATCVDTMDDYVCLCPREPVMYMGKDCAELYDGCAFAPCANCTSTPGTQEYHCVCLPGFAGTHCLLDVDECASRPCEEPRSRCVDRVDGYTCHCPRGRTGDSCLDVSEECVDQPCLNGATCLEQHDGFECECPPGYGGIRCHEDVDECQSRPCRNGAICQDAINAYRCFCVPGFQGYNCEIDINECASRPCKNNGSCINGKDRYACVCQPGYTGMNCELEIDECSSSPCQNGATCQDHLDLYICTCLPGYEGVDCEVDVDECASKPCLNHGTCVDWVDSYECDCSDTGFTGPQCEEDIPECASNPCQHNSTCEEGVNQYRCQCWPGYEGKHCEVDIDECAEEPCENGGECFQWSHKAQYSTLLGRDREFSYADAAGYLCRCQPGFTGENCSVDIDECVSQPCHNGGTCEDLVNGYACVCQPGFTDTDCQVNIDECEGHPCQNRAICKDAVADYICHCPEALPGDTYWGGHDCDIPLVGCVGHQCENGATCQPQLEADGKHGYSCHCPPGFYGDHCHTPTTFSFSTPGFMIIKVPLTNRTRRHLAVSQSGVQLRFRTTLPNMVVLYRGDVDDYLSLEIVGGGLLARAAMAGGKQLEVSLPGPVHDGRWHQASVTIGQTLVLELSGAGCKPGDCMMEDTSDLWDSFHIPWSFTQLFVGGAPAEFLGNTENEIGFIGCMEDLLVDSLPILPQSLSQDKAWDMELGCSKTEWCQLDPCSGHGHCVDLWTTFFCECYRPFHGESCSEEYRSWTFSHEDTVSYVSYTVRKSHGSNFTISLFLRSLKQDGLVFQLRHEDEAYLTVYLKMGQVSIDTLSAPPVAAPVFVTTGERQLLEVEFHQGQVFFSQGGILHYQLDDIPVVFVEAGDIAYVGGLPPGEDVEAWGGSFKGCLQDVRLDNVRLDIDPWNSTLNPTDEESYLPHDIDNVEPGCVTDDTCQAEPCLNGGKCTVTWNNFVCFCTVNFTGRTCETRMWCPSKPCAKGGHCMDLPGGYECITEATFENNNLQYTAKGSLVSPVTGMAMALRTRAENGLLLEASSGEEFLRLSLLNGYLLMEMYSRTNKEVFSLAGETAVADGHWHQVHISAMDPQQETSVWAITLDSRTKASRTHASTNLNFLNESKVSLAQSFTGCLGEVRIGDVYLPFVDDLNPPQRSRFFRQGGVDAQVGCISPPVCLSQPCLNHGTCEDMFGLFRCICAPGWDGKYCQDNMDDCASTPCIHGSCYDLLADYECECLPGYGGKACEEDVDDCQGHGCQNGGSCVDGLDSYTCICPPDFSGPLCQWRFPPLQCKTDVNCVHGICHDEPWGARCTCKAGYTGDRCQAEIDECESNPCQHGGSCLDRINRFQCVCLPGFMGSQCESSRQEQKERVPWMVVVVPLVSFCVLLGAIGLAYIMLTARRKRQSEGIYSPSQQEVAGARLEMESMLKVPPEERLI